MSWCEPDQCGNKCPLNRAEEVQTIMRQQKTTWSLKISTELQQAFEQSGINPCIWCLGWITFEPKKATND